MLGQRRDPRARARESGFQAGVRRAHEPCKAVELGLTGSRFVEFTGLDEHNVSTASDVARLLHAAAHEPLIQGDHDDALVRVLDRAPRARDSPNTNRLLYGRYDVLGGKTGFIIEAGYCFAIGSARRAAT